MAGGNIYHFIKEAGNVKTQGVLLVYDRIACRCNFLGQ